MKAPKVDLYDNGGVRDMDAFSQVEDGARLELPSCGWFAGIIIFFFIVALVLWTLGGI